MGESSTRDIRLQDLGRCPFTTLYARNDFHSCGPRFGLDSRVAMMIKRTCSLRKFRLRIHALGDVGERFGTLGTLRRYNSLIRLREWPHLWLGYYTMRVRIFVLQVEKLYASGDVAGLGKNIPTK